MRHTIFWRHAYLALLLAALAMPASARSITLCHEDEDVRPWILKESKGLNMILLELVAAKSRINLKLNAMPWKRCLAEIEAGRMDGGFAASYKGERAQYAVYPGVKDKLDVARRLHSNTYSLYRIKGSTINWDGNKFANLTGAIGAQFGYSIADDLRKLGVNVDDGAKPSEANLQKLLVGRVQAVALLTLEADQLLSMDAKLASKIEKIKTPLVDKPYFVIFGKAFYSQNKKAVEDFWDMIETVRKSADYQSRQAAFMKSNSRG